MYHAPEKRFDRADLCRFVAACYYEPVPAFTEERLFDSMCEAASRLDPSLARHAQNLKDAFSAELLDKLLVDYTHLFLGSGATFAKPYGSIWTNGETGLM